MFRIDDDLKEFVESPLAVLVGTGSAEGRPHAAYGWATRVREDRQSVDVFLDTERADETLRNLRDTGKIAVTLADPVSYRSVQLKGHFAESAVPDKADLKWVRDQRNGFLVVTSLIGDPPALIRTLWLDDVLRVSFNVERAYDQTPGPEAGRPL